jgi:ABC-type molybdate transport system substrate-binding protein
MSHARFITALFALAGLIAAGLAGCDGDKKGDGERAGNAAPPRILLYVGTSMQKPMEGCVAAYTEQADVKIEPNYGESGEVQVWADMIGKGDAAVLHEPYLTKSIDEGWGAKVHVLANMRPAVVVRIDNDKTRNVAGLMDLAREDLKVGLTDAKATTSGQLVQAALKKAGIREKVMARVRLQNKSSGFMCKQLIIGTQLDAITCWDAVAGQHADRLRAIPIEKQYMPQTFTDSEGMTYTDGRVAVGLIELKTSAHPEATRKFVRFILSPEGQAIWKAAGFNPAVEAPTTQPES